MTDISEAKSLAIQGKVRMSASEAFVETLVANGVDTTFGIVGSAYMDVLMAPESLALYRVVIGESGRFPDLGMAVFHAGPTVAADRLAAYLRQEVARGRLRLADCAAAARQFLEMIKGDLHLRALMDAAHPPSAGEVAKCIRLAVAIFLGGARPRAEKCPPGPR